MKSPTQRATKYENKIDPDVIKARFLAHKPAMVEQEQAIFGEISEVERKAKIVCENAGITTGQIPQYLNFARKCYKIGKKFSGLTKDNEILYWFNLFVSRGYTAGVLADVAELCGSPIAGY